MPQDINLLPEETPQDKQQARTTRTINRIGVIALAVTLTVVVGLFTANTIISAQINSVEQQIDQQKQRIAAKKVEEGIQVAINKKLERLNTFFDSQKSYAAFLDKLSKTVPESVRLTDLKVDEVNKVTISGQATSYADLAGFYDKLRTAGATEEGQVGTYFVDPKLTTISLNSETRQITFTITFTASAAVLEAAE